MSVGPGMRIGQYQIVDKLGEGGMGEVYRARDPQLGRDVAIKVLPQAFSADPERLTRFDREAQVLASLNHPNIAHVYGLERADGAQALVMELVDGPTLADRIAGRPMAVDDAIAVAVQIVDALAAAHDRGVVHRDLKPANLKIRPDGLVKVLDFGLAKLADGRGGSTVSAGGAPSFSPTITSPVHLTTAGVLLGTAGYMSPEQARGLIVDRGADIWAFGCVLFEMLSGARAFAGTDAAETIAAIIRSEPEWTRLPVDTPPALRRLLRRCLQKDRAKRLADLRDARLDLEEARSDGAAPVAPEGRRGRTGERAAWVAACLACAVVAAAVTAWRGTAANPAPRVGERHVEITTPPTTDHVSLAISPDAEKLAFVASSDGRSKLWLRSLVTGAAQPLTGTDGASFPFWSPDSRSIGFFANGHLYRVDADGSSLRALAVAPVGTGGTWSRDGVILFTVVPDAPISRVSAAGGPSSPLSKPAGPEPGQRFPQFLPDGRHFLYFVAERESRGVYVGALDARDRRRLFDADAAAVFVAPARVLFLRGGTLFTQAFNANLLQLEGSPVPLADAISVDAAGAAAVSGAAAAIVYRQGPPNRQRQLIWFDRSGRDVGVVAPPDASTPTNPALSPDGRLMALNRSVEGDVDIWLVDMARGVLSRFTVEPGPQIYPVWSPDASRIVYASSGPSRRGFNLFQRTVASSARESSLIDAPKNMIPDDWSRDGRFISYIVQDDAGRWDIEAIAMADPGRPITVTHTNFDEMGSQFSPDGRWIAYESNESGRNEIYVQPFPGTASKVIVSTGGGLQPRWGPLGKELFYVAPDGHLMAVPIHVSGDGRAIVPSVPTPLFVAPISSTRTGGSRQEYVVSSDGQRFLMNTFVEHTGSPITLVLNPVSR
jgi:eukaryotic-like serine/threonine-protein kinase